MHPNYLFSLLLCGVSVRINTHTCPGLLLIPPLKDRPQDVVVMPVWFFRYQGNVGSSLIVGGVDVTGAHLYSVYPHGSYDKLPFLTMGACECV